VNGGILNGYPDGTFKPNGSITRAEFAAIAVRFEFSGDINLLPDVPSPFSDVSGHWAEKYINLAAELGYVNGYSDGTFHPNAPITRAEAAKLLNNVLKRRVETDDDLLDDMVKWNDNQPGTWFYLPVQEATNSHFYDWKDDGIFEVWSEMRKNPEWSLLEKPDSQPGDLVYDTPAAPLLP
jgi:hypothetical protein